MCEKCVARLGPIVEEETQKLTALLPDASKVSIRGQAPSLGELLLAASNTCPADYVKVRRVLLFACCIVVGHDFEEEVGRPFDEEAQREALRSLDITLGQAFEVTLDIIEEHRMARAILVAVQGQGPAADESQQR